MSTRTNVKAKTRARYLLATLVALVFAMALAAPSAFAETGKISINQVAGNTENTYNGYQIFTADVDKDGNATNIQWGGINETEQGKVAEAVKAAIAAYAAANADNAAKPNVAADAAKVAASGSTAQDAADFVSKYLEGSSDLEQVIAPVYYTTEDETAGTIPNGKKVGDLKTAGTYTYATTDRVGNASLANLIAQQIDLKNATAYTTVTGGTTDVPGTPVEVAEGYYLFVTNPDTINTDVKPAEMGTSAIYQLINADKEVTVTEKTKIPTVKKEVKEDGKTYTPDQAEGTYYKKTDGTYTTTAPSDVADGTITDTAYVTIDTDNSGEADSYAKFVQDEPWRKVADANIGQAMDYRLTGTLPDNLATFSSYYYEFTDSMTKGIDLLDKMGAVITATTEGAAVATVKDAVTVKIGDKEVAKDSFNATYKLGDQDKRILSIEFNPVKKDDGTSDTGDTDLFIAKDTEGNPITVTKDSVITVEYKAALNQDCIVAGTGNPNTVDLEYSNNPNKDSKGKTVEDENKLYTFKLDLEKVRKGAESTKLAGAKFTIQVKSTADDGNAGKYVQADGKLGDTVYEFTTDKNGMLTVSGLDAQTYIIHETKAPDGYNTMDADIEFTITATYGTNDSPLNLGTLTASMKGGNDDVAAGDKNDAGILNSGAAGTGIVSVNGNAATNENAMNNGSEASNETAHTTGNVNLKVTNEQRITMPLTGMDGITFTYILGGIILAVSVFALLRRKMSNRVQEDVA